MLKNCGALVMWNSYGESLALVMQFVSQVTDFVKYVKVHVLKCITFGTTIATESHIQRRPGEQL